MGALDIVLILVIAVIIGGAVWYIYRSQKKGQKCIGCPHSGNCSGNCSDCFGAHKK